MKKFPHWRKMTWAIGLWVGATVVWAVHAATTSSTVVADCAAASAVRAGTISQQDCVSQATIGIQFGVMVIAIIGLVGLVVLGAAWFSSRPLWRQGYGPRLRPLRLSSGALAIQPGELWRSRFDG